MNVSVAYAYDRGMFAFRLRSCFHVRDRQAPVRELKVDVMLGVAPGSPSALNPDDLFLVEAFELLQLALWNAANFVLAERRTAGDSTFVADVQQLHARQQARRGLP